MSRATLKRWSDEGKLSFVTTPGGKHLYSEKDIKKIFKSEEPEGTTEPEEKIKINIIYARVSSNHQKEDLKRQIKDLKEKHPEHTIIKDIGSGLDFKRKGLQTLLEQCSKGLIGEVVVSNKDRLCRFGIEVFEWLFERFETKLLVCSSDIEFEDNKQRELSEDIISIITFFTAKHNGMCAAENRRNRKRIEEGRRRETSRICSEQSEENNSEYEREKIVADRKEKSSSEES